MAKRAKIVHRSAFQRRVIPDMDTNDDVGVLATVEIVIPHGDDGTGICQRITSPGLWGIDGASDDAYLIEVYHDECEVLTDMLNELGYTVTGSAAWRKQETKA